MDQSTRAPLFKHPLLVQILGVCLREGSSWRAYCSLVCCRLSGHVLYVRIAIHQCVLLSIEPPYVLQRGTASCGGVGEGPGDREARREGGYRFL